MGDDRCPQWRHSGTPATGKPFRIRGCGVGRVDDNKIVELTEYWNTAAFLMQLGIPPTPTAQEWADPATGRQGHAIGRSALRALDGILPVALPSPHPTSIVTGQVSGVAA